MQPAGVLCLHRQAQHAAVGNLLLAASPGLHLADCLAPCPRVAQAVSQASIATVVALATHGSFSKLATAPFMQHVRRSLAPAARRQLPALAARTSMVKTVVQKPVYAVGTAAVATCAGVAGRVEGGGCRCAAPESKGNGV